MKPTKSKVVVVRVSEDVAVKISFLKRAKRYTPSQALGSAILQILYTFRHSGVSKRKTMSAMMSPCAYGPNAIGTRIMPREAELLKRIADECRCSRDFVLRVALASWLGTKEIALCLSGAIEGGAE
jgi:predicted transcriptional regulator